MSLLQQAIDMIAPYFIILLCLLPDNFTRPGDSPGA